MPKNKRTAIKSISQSPVKNTPNKRETRASTFSSRQAPNRIFLAVITQNYKGRKKMNNKVQVFEKEEPNKIPNTLIDDPETSHQRNTHQDDEL